MRSFVDGARRLLFMHGGLPLVFVVLTCITLIPVWHQRMLPMLDTPNHLALVRGWHSFKDPSWHISDFYALRLRPVPYMLFYAFINGAMYLFSIETANKLFLSGYLILFPLAVASLARALKRSPWLAIGAFALEFNQGWIYGFSSYLMGTALFFLGLALLIRFLDEGGRGRAWALSLVCVLMYFGHVLPWFCFGLCAMVLLALEWKRGLRRLATAAAAMLPSLLLAIIAVIDERAERSYMKVGESFSGGWRDFPQDVSEFPRRIMEIFPGKLDYAVLAVITLTVVGLAVWGGVGKSWESRETRILKWILIVLGLVYLSLPYSISKPMSWWYVSPRLPALMAPVILLLPIMRIEGRARLLMIPMIVACMTLSLKLARLYKDFSNRNAAFMRLVDEVPRGKTCFVAFRGMIKGANAEEKSGDPATAAPVYWHWTSWPMALKGGYGPHVFDQGVPIKPVHTLVSPAYTSADLFDIRQAPDYDYYLVRTPMESMSREPSIKQVNQIGEWVLYKRIGKLTDEP